VTPHTAGSDFLHQAFLYGSTDDFVETMASFMREGLERGDPVFVATKGSNVEALTEELGDDRERVELHDTTEWCTRPYERLQAFKRLVAALPPGRVLRAAGEPVWAGSDAVIRQWARYESIINLALAESPMRFICLYDGAGLPDRILDYAVCTHPERVENGSSISCSTFVSPEEFLPGAPPVPPASAWDLTLETAAFRKAVAVHARAAGLPRNRTDDFVLATHEVATNALMHGRPPVEAHLWADDGELICQIADAGHWKANPLAGWLPRTPPALGGWGLPIARQLCDAVEITPRETGTIVSLYVSLAEPDGRTVRAA
jgi:anti-sigma regulatory factor (Ser/Thr protein kinase)